MTLLQCAPLTNRHVQPRPATPAPAPAANYRTRLATDQADLEAAQRLRFEIFNRELSEGLAESWQNEMDQDRFDEVCDHLLVEHIHTGEIVGTYRLQSGPMAARNLGYYSAQEFDFAPYEPFRETIVELGRACVHLQHRKASVLNMLWRGIAEYAHARGACHLLGCSSLTSQDPALAHATYALLTEKFLAAPEFRTTPLPAFVCPEAAPLTPYPPPPRLLRAYLNIGAKICGPPALDRDFKTIDFLTLIDLRSLPAVVHNHFVGGE